jgi:hypothetical protein
MKQNVHDGRAKKTLSEMASIWRILAMSWAVLTDFLIA